MKNKVLEIGITTINNEYSCVCIVHQDLNVIKRGKFCNPEIGVTSAIYPEYSKSDRTLYVLGSEANRDNKPFIVENSDLEVIRNIVDLVNSKYEIYRRWRAENGEIYYYINDCCSIVRSYECKTDVDDKRYGYGNYFKTAREAELSVLYKAFQEMKIN